MQLFMLLRNTVRLQLLFNINVFKIKSYLMTFFLSFQKFKKNRY